MARCYYRGQTSEAHQLLNLVHEFDPSKRSSSENESTIEELLKNLKPSLVELSYPEWGAILETFLQPDEMRNRTREMNLIFKSAIQLGGQSGLLVSHLMIDLFEQCYGREAEAIVAQRQNVLATVQSLRMDTNINFFTNQLMVEYEALHNLERIYGGPRLMQLQENELAVMLSNHVSEHIDIHLSVDINAWIDVQVTGGPEVSIQSALDQIEKYKHLRARIGKAAAASSTGEHGECQKDKKSKGGTTANQASVTKAQ